MQAFLLACTALLCSVEAAPSSRAPPRGADERPNRRRGRRRTRSDPYLHHGSKSSKAGGSKTSKAKGYKSKQGKGHFLHGGTHFADMSLAYGDAALLLGMFDDDGEGEAESAAEELPQLAPIDVDDDEEFDDDSQGDAEDADAPAGSSVGLVSPPVQASFGGAETEDPIAGASIDDVEGAEEEEGVDIPLPAGASNDGFLVEFLPPPVQASFGEVGAASSRPSAAPSIDPTSSSSLPFTQFEREDAVSAKCKTSAVDRSMSFLRLLGADPSVRRGLLSMDGPVYEAWIWLVYLDDMVLCADPGPDDWRIRQRHALASLYYSTGGDASWTNCPSGLPRIDGGVIGPCHPRNRDGLVLDADFADASAPVRFLDGSDECDWFGVSCGDAGRVDGIILPSNGLRGPIPEGLYPAVKGLRVLNLSMNGVEGGLSRGVGELAELEELKL